MLKWILLLTAAMRGLPKGGRFLDDMNLFIFSAYLP
jgi:hypothetical protein